MCGLQQAPQHAGQNCSFLTFSLKLELLPRLSILVQSHPKILSAIIVKISYKSEAGGTR